MGARLDRYIRWTRVVTAAAAATGEECLELDITLSAREKAIYLLQVVSTVEHALLVQYLYAALSLGGPQLTHEEQEKAQQWRTTILDIARQEMGHLASVQNVLTLLGGPLSFARDEFPFGEELYPFPFELERLTKKSLGKYVLAESPSEKVLAQLHLVKEIAEIRRYVGVFDPAKIHRVGKIYSEILRLFQPPPTTRETPPCAATGFIGTLDILAGSYPFQVKPSEWRLNYPALLIETATDRGSGWAAINQVAIQGEGDTIDDLSNTHFGRFLEIYRQFPFENEWQPSRDVARNPTTVPGPSDGPTSTITDPMALMWAKLFNLRYRMLLMFLEHSFHVEGTVPASQPTPRGLLISWAFGEMYNLRSIGDILVTLPLQKNKLLPFAGPPFEMPYSLSLSPRGPGRWRQHRDSFVVSQQYVAELQESKAIPANFLSGLAAADQEALDQIAAMIGGNDA